MFRMFTRAAVALMLATGVAAAQQADPGVRPADERGFVSFAEFGSSFNANGHVLKLDTSAGYNLTNYLGVDFGVPFYFTGGSATTSTGKTSFSASGMGAPYVVARATYRSESFNYAGRFTVFLPYGDDKSGLSTRQTSIDWTNHFEHGGRFTPFGDIGIANTVPDTSKYNRPYASYGNNVHFEGGATYDITDRVSAGGSLYDIVPWGTQAIYSRAVPKGSSNLPGNSSKSRAFEQFSFLTGTSDLGKDNGFSAWADYTPAPYVTAEVAYTRSFELELNTVSFSVRFNLGYLAKNKGHK